MASVRVWDQFLTASDRAHLKRSRAKDPYGFGKRWAVLSVDNYRAGVGDQPLPLLDSIETWPSSTGMMGWEALENISRMFKLARSVGVPILHITGLAEADSGMPGWSARRGGYARGKGEAAKDAKRARHYEIVGQAAPLPGELILQKNSPSAFFGTPLAAHLVSQGIDTLIVCGQSASGCVRATVVDGCSYRLHVIVVEDCVYDRHESARAMNLFDMHQKYADVMNLEAVVARLSEYAQID